MMQVPDIPRVYTALAEWLACIVYICHIPGYKTGKRQTIFRFCVLIVLAAFLHMTRMVSSDFCWLLCMAAAVGMMYLLIYTSTDLGLVNAGYICVRAFILAEFAASLQWQLHCFFFPDASGLSYQGLLMLVAVYLLVYTLIYAMEHKIMASMQTHQLTVTGRELLNAVIIGLMVFALSNLSFVSPDTPFSGQYSGDVLNIRTIVDFGGLAIMYAFHIQFCSVRARYELEAMQSVLQNHYEQYQISRESIEIINRKYHDLKHQIATLRAMPDAGERSAYLDQMEAEINNYESQNKTGNSVLDSILTSKSMACKQYDIQFTCVADGRLLEFMSVMDLCSIFGNALDNAIDYEKTVQNPEKRLIHLSVSAQRGFILIRTENYCPTLLNFENGLPTTTKGNTAYHGYGLKSIRFIAQKYGGTATVIAKDDWFELRILIPRH